ncbi:hypothetical protein SLE2022_040650 [Rubroshorea leprosula]
MKISKVSMALACLLALALVIPSHAQNSPKDYLDGHNAARAAVNVGPISWNDTIAAYARNYLRKHIGDCNMVESGGAYGENLGWNSVDLTGTDTVAMWVNEKSDYDYNSNSCAPNKVCGHYTQVVWRKSVRMGCAKVRCNNGGTLVSCNYDPTGNYFGEKPY